MKASSIIIFAIISLLWCLNGILSIQVYENVTETQKPPFTIDASTMISMNPTAPAESQSINLFLPEDSQVSTKNPKSEDNERHVKSQLYVAENQKAKHYSDMYLKNVKPTQETENAPDPRKQQSWQIPSPLSPLSTSDPKTINSTKRQTDEDIESTRAFIPSQELGSFDNTEGFVPHHEPKTIQYLAPNYLPSKPLKHDVNYGYAVGEPRLPVDANKGLQSFEHDFEDLKSKYPELDDLVNNYPIMEEIMKQKLAEKFQQSYYLKHHNGNSEEKSKVKVSSQEQSQEYGVNFKYSPNSNENQQYKPQTAPERPFHFESDKFKIFKFPPKKMQYDQDASTAETPYAGEYYQGPKFPITAYAGYDEQHKNYSSVDIKGILPGVSKTKKPISPWKRVLHLITAFLPVGILLSALTPNVINIANVPDKTYPIRQRSIDDDENVNSKLLLNFLNGNDAKENSTAPEDPECDERKFCDMSQRGKNSDSTVVEKIFWNLAHSTPDQVAELVGMKNLFKAVKNSECAKFPCKNNQNNTPNVSNIHENTSEATKNKGEIRRIKRKRDKAFVYNKY